MKTVVIHWYDLTEAKKKEICKIAGYNPEREIYPISHLPIGKINVKEKEFKTFDVLVTIRATKKVTASSFDEAEKEANFYIGEHDFGDLRDIDWEVDCVKNECNNFKL